MSGNHSVTLEIERLKAGRDSALEPLWSRYRGRLVRVAKKSLGEGAHRSADEEDVVQSALVSFWEGARDQQFAELHNRDNLWPLLRLIVQRKANHYRIRQQRQKRGGGKVRGESVFLTPGSSSAVIGGLDGAGGNDGTPSRLAQAEEAAERLLQCLADDKLRQIALWKAEGRTNEEIAELLSCSRSTVVRKLDLIRMIWRTETEA